MTQDGEHSRVYTYIKKDVDRLKREKDELENVASNYQLDINVLTDRLNKLSAQYHHSHHDSSAMLNKLDSLTEMNKSREQD